MSQSLEESPLSDIKMDISEATTSQESLGVSPDIENDEPNITKTTTRTTTIKSKTEKTKPLELELFDDDGDDNNDDNDQKLDNRDNNLIDNDNSQRNTLTLVSNHPLMSPQPTSSSSTSIDNERSTAIFNYPDLVPEIEQHHEPLRLGGNNEQFDYNNQINSTTTTNATNNTTQTSTRRKISLLRRDTSPDIFISSDSEPDLSQYQATVAPTFEAVALVATGYKTTTISTSKPAFRRKIPVSSDILSDDASSLDTLSNQSFDEDLEQNLVSLSPSSSVLDDQGFDDPLTPTLEPTNIVPLPLYTAAEERRDSRNWQKITLPDGKTREIDMKVIDPYKRVLSHGGYLKAGGNNAIVVFSACHLPDRSRTDYHYVMDNLFLYVVKTLEQLVTEDYVLVYLHGGSSRGNVPPFPWLKKCYQLIDRRLRKSLKNLYLVHPTFWLKSMVWMSRPFISSKFWKKMVYIKSLEELYTLVPVEKASVPDKVKNYNSKFT